jgi:uncharacterized protein YndB with AHSA1/START domain
MSDEAVRVRTGKTWPEWFHLLDTAGATGMTHQQIVAYLVREHGLGSWWQQMVTVTYEQARGLREKHQRPDGYQISRSKVLPVSIDLLYAAWLDPRQRLRWLGDMEINITTATPGKSIRASLPDGTRLDVNYYLKGEGKSQVTVEHQKLPDATSAEARKTFWSDALNRLKAYLEQG